jgi:hypothetical protein
VLRRGVHDSPRQRNGLLLMRRTVENELLE